MNDDVPLQLPDGHELRGRSAAVATKHDKTATIARALGGPAGLWLQTAVVDTDTLGTFTGETARTGTPGETAVVKARWACRESGLDLGIGSEGSFAPHPQVGLITMQIEHVALTQASTGLTVIGTAIGGAPWALRRTVTLTHDLDAFSEVLDSGSQCLIVRPDTGAVTDHCEAITKGIATTEGLRTAVKKAIGHSESGRVIVESDLRAHRCSPRHDLIRTAARDLADRLATRCPTCSSPGFGHRESRSGAPCAWCGGPTTTLLHHIYSCPACPFSDTETVPGTGSADPGTCPACNP